MRKRDLERLEAYRRQGLEGSIKKWKLLKRVLKLMRTHRGVLDWFNAVADACGLCREYGSCVYCPLAAKLKIKGCSWWPKYDSLLTLALRVEDGEKKIKEVKPAMLKLCDEIIETLESLKT